QPEAVELIAQIVMTVHVVPGGGTGPGAEPGERLNLLQNRVRLPGGAGREERAGQLHQIAVGLDGAGDVSFSESELRMPQQFPDRCAIVNADAKLRVSIGVALDAMA